MIFSESHIAEWSESCTYGHSVLASLQNHSIPQLDLLVREAVQNSSDAAIDSDHNSVHVDFRVGDFDAPAFNREFAGLDELLPGFTEGLPARFLEIRDKKTSGLTGSYRRPDDGDHSNFVKLIFDSGKTQASDRESGGSWGYGKSVYYRVSSIGLVIFYTHINEPDTGSEHRLIATLVEDEEDQASILGRIKKASIGRGWWGAPPDEESGVNVFPILDLGAITEFLNLFGLKPFKESDTGTSVIIPYIDEEKLLADVIPAGSLSDDEIQRCVWRESVEQYITHALKKWYAPKLHNTKLDELARQGKGRERWIRASVNGEMLRFDEMGRFFQLIQELYTTARLEVAGIHYPHEMFPGIRSDSINLRKGRGSKEVKLFEGPVGVVSYIEITDGELYPGYSDLSPYVLTGNFENLEEVNEPILAFTRQLGMVISYGISGDWVKGIPAPKSNPGSPDDRYIIGFFVPKASLSFNSEKERELYRTLGGYLKACEQADHTSWDDRPEVKIVSKIQINVCRKIKSSVEEADNRTAKPSIESRLSSRLGRFFMPPVDTRKPSVPNRDGGSSKAPTGRSGRFEVGKPTFENGCVKIPFALPMGDSPHWSLCVEVRSEKGSIKLDSWAKEIGSAYPLSIEQIEITLEAKDGSAIKAGASCGLATGQSLDEQKLTVKLDKGQLDAYACAQIFCSVPGQVLKGVAVLSSSDNKIECDLKAYQRKGE